MLVDPRNFKACGRRLANCKMRENKQDGETSENPSPKLYSDSSSDSGYDECSNQGITLETAFKKDQVSIELNNKVLIN